MMANPKMQRTGNRRHTQLIHLPSGKKSGMQMKMACRVQAFRQSGLHQASRISRSAGSGAIGVKDCDRPATLGKSPSGTSTGKACSRDMYGSG